MPAGTPLSPPAFGAFTPEQKEYLAGFMAGVAAGGVFRRHQLRRPADRGARRSRFFQPRRAPDGGHGFRHAARRPLQGGALEARRESLDAWSGCCGTPTRTGFPTREYLPLQVLRPLLRRPRAGQLHAPPARPRLRTHGRATARRRGSRQRSRRRLRAPHHARQPADPGMQAARHHPGPDARAGAGSHVAGAGCDNIRNITASPNSGFDPGELLDVRRSPRACTTTSSTTAISTASRGNSTSPSTTAAASPSPPTPTTSASSPAVSTEKSLEANVGGVPSPRIDPGIYSASNWAASPATATSPATSACSSAPPRRSPSRPR